MMGRVPRRRLPIWLLIRPSICRSERRQRGQWRRRPGLPAGGCGLPCGGPRAGRTVYSARGDVSVEADDGRMVGEVLSRYGRLDILGNNAGAPQGVDRNEIEDVPVEAWDRTMGVNARGAFLMSRAAVPAMRKAGWGRIVSVSS